MADMYKNANTMVQVRNFNYVPKTNSLVLYNADVLTIEKMRQILGLFKKEQDSEKEASNIQEKQLEEKDYISDNDLLSNPFFTTLTPLN